MELAYENQVGRGQMKASLSPFLFLSFDVWVFGRSFWFLAPLPPLLSPLPLLFLPSFVPCRL